MFIKRVLTLILLSTCFTIPVMPISNADVCSSIKSEGLYIEKYKGDWYGEKFAKRQFKYFELLLKNPKCSTKLDRVSDAQEMVRAVLQACDEKMPEFFQGYGPSTSKWLCNWANSNKKRLR